MTTSTLSDENDYVEELNRLFLSCAKNGDTHLDASGLQDLFIKLNLSCFTDVILEQILNGCTIVDFTIFKERFMHLLPDIINVTTVLGDIGSDGGKNLPALGIDRRFLTRHEARILCEHSSELDSKQADFITETFVPSVNLFEALDPSNTGIVRCQELLEHWQACGISIEHGLYVLKLSGQPLEGTVNAISLSGSLERQLSNLVASPTASTVIRVALLSLHAFIDHIRHSLKEAELRAEHFYKQFQQTNQRHVLLIEELEQNQISIEQAYEQRFRSSDERYRIKISQTEERFSQEKKDLLAELEKAEEEISRFRKNELSYHTRLHLLEQQCTQLTEEAKELSETMQQLEQVNRHLRNKLNKALHRPVDETKPTMILAHSVDLLIMHNKRLREKIQELTSNRKKRNSHFSMVEPHYSHWTDTFRMEMLALKRRKEGRPVDTLSEMESEPESIFIRSKKRRMLKVKERKRRHDRIARIAENSSNEWIVNARKEETTLAVGLNKGSNELKNNVMQRFEEQHQDETVVVKHSVNKSLSDALTDQKQQITPRQFLLLKTVKFMLNLLQMRVIMMFGGASLQSN